MGIYKTNLEKEAFEALEEVRDELPPGRYRKIRQLIPELGEYLDEKNASRESNWVGEKVEVLETEEIYMKQVRAVIYDLVAWLTANS